jgi:hypothetical protein
LLIEAIETGERVQIPYGWEQIGSKQVTSSQMQMWSARRSVAAMTGWPLVLHTCRRTSDRAGSINLYRRRGPHQLHRRR